MFFMNAAVVFSLQLLLFTIYLYGISNKSRLDDVGFFLMTNFDIAVARTCNAILMHMLVESEVRQAL